jgi:hypothetical protein
MRNEAASVGGLFFDFDFWLLPICGLKGHREKSQFAKSKTRLNKTTRSGIDKSSVLRGPYKRLACSLLLLWREAQLLD